MSRALLPIRHREAFLDDRMGFEDGQMVTDGKDGACLRQTPGQRLESDVCREGPRASTELRARV